MEHPEWLKAALQRIKDRQPVPELLDTPEKAAAEGEPIGTVVLRRAPPEVLRSPQEHLDDMRAMDMIRAGLVEWP